MGEDQAAAMRLSYNGSLRVEGRGHRLTGSAGALLLREVDERLLGLTEFLAERLTDPRNPDYVTYSLAELLRTRLYGVALGHRRQDDFDALRDDPGLRAAVADGRGLSALETDGSHLASQPTFSRLTKCLSENGNLAVLRESLLESVRRDVFAHRPGAYAEVVLDVDSFPVEVHGHQAGSAYNGYYRTRCYHPIATFLSETGHCIAADLRPGNVHTAENATVHLLNAIYGVRTSGIADAVTIRGDAGFPSEQLLTTLERSEVEFAFRLTSNTVLDALATPYLRRPQGGRPRKPREWTFDLQYQAGSWSRPRRVVLVVLERPGELLLDSFFIVTSWTPRKKRSRSVLEFYRRRGTLEKHLGEFKTILEPTLSSTTRRKTHRRGAALESRYPSRDAERCNAANFLVFVLAYNLLNTTRRVAAQRTNQRPGLRSIVVGLLLIVARLTISARRATFTINETAAQAWSVFLRRLDRLVPI